MIELRTVSIVAAALTITGGLIWMQTNAYAQGQKKQEKISYEEAFKRCKAFMDKEKGSLGAGTTSDANKSSRGAACMKKFGHKL